MRNAVLSMAGWLALATILTGAAGCSSSDASGGETGPVDGGAGDSAAEGSPADGSSSDGAANDGHSSDGSSSDGAKDVTTTDAGDGDDTKETASALTLGTVVKAKLDPVATDQDWYELDGKADQAISIATQAKTGSDPFDATYPDLVVTLFDANGTQLAEQDDPTPRSSNDPMLFTVLPAAGTYYVRVLDCNAWSKGGAGHCSDATQITHKDYSLLVSEMTFSSAGEIKEVEPNGDATSATPLTSAPNQQSPGHYYLSVLHGTFSDASDVDVYGFTVPSDLAVDPASRAVTNFYLQPPTVDGNGSTTSPGRVRITTAADPATVIALVDDATGASLGVPLTVGAQYLVFYERAPASTGAHDFYFDLQGFGSGNPVEAQDAANDVVATAETLTEATDQAGSYFIEGNLTSAADVDHFSFAVPATNADQVSVACAAARAGSGLRDFTVALLNGDGTPIANATATEAADKNLLLSQVATPSGQTKLVVKLTAGSQAADVTSNFYRCGVHFSAATP